MNIYCNGHGFDYEAGNIARLFFDEVKVISDIPQEISDSEYVLTFADASENSCRTKCVVKIKDKVFESSCDENPECETGERTLGKAMYKALSAATGVKPPWGILTGIRPVRLVEAHQSDPMDFFVNSSLVSEEKAKLAIATYSNENRIIGLSLPESFSLYIGIPFCPSRCSYCSFVSKTVENAGKLIDEYVKYLVKEINFTGEIVAKLGLKLESVYFGGGTPTALSAVQLDRLMKAVSESFDLSQIREYTVEGGRPETLTEDKLATLIQNGVDRLSINPQTMNNDVLLAAGRRHTVEDVYSAYTLARTFPFKTINMDLIAGLPGDDVQGFKHSLDEVKSLCPENITIHTLCIKRAAFINEDRPALPSDKEVEEMLSYASTGLDKAGYVPYYLYRQRNTLANAENVGWSLTGHECLYNVFTMDQTHTIVSCGAGGVTIMKQPNGTRIERIFNYKYPYEYLSRFEILLKKRMRFRSSTADTDIELLKNRKGTEL